MNGDETKYSKRKKTRQKEKSDCKAKEEPPIEYFGTCKECGHFLDVDGDCAFCPWFNDSLVRKFRIGALKSNILRGKT